MNNTGWTALHCAAGNGKQAMVEQLLRAKANPDAVDKYGDTAERWAKKQWLPCIGAKADGGSSQALSRK